tara:strand:- start:96 stop:275 length:180 start_codon:yes stop_codon:yes gene_type:complete
MIKLRQIKKIGSPPDWQCFFNYWRDRKQDKEISKKDWFTSGEISWEEYWNDPSWEIEND